MLTRLAGFIVRRPRLVLIVASVALVAMGAVGFGAFGKLQTGGFEDPADESTVAQDVISENFDDQADVVILARVAEGDVDDAATADAGKELSDELASDGELTNVISYWTAGAPSLRSDDGTEALIVANLAGDADDIADRYSGDYGPLEVTVGGSAIIEEDLPAQVSQDLAVAESIAVPVILILLVFAFGSLVAAMLPLVVGAIAIFGTFAELSILGSVTDVSIFAINLTTALGLALGIDYALLMVSRYREELATGASVRDAVVKTIETAGRTIIFSGLAVAAALAALLLFPLFFLRSFAYAGIGVVVIAVAGALIVLPALLAVLGPRVNAGKLPWSRSVTRGSAAPFWGRLASGVMRRPVVTGGAVAVLLLVMAAPLLRIDFGTPDERVLPTSAPSRQVGDSLRGNFSGDDTAAITGVTTSTIANDQLSGYATALSELTGVHRVETGVGTFVDGQLAADPAPTAAFTSGDATRLSVVIPADPRSEEAKDLVAAVRAVPQPAAAEFLIGGDTAILIDSLDSIGEQLPYAVGMVILTTLLVLFLFTGTLVQPIRALITNGLTLAATFGLMVLIFQDGNGAGLLGFTPMPLDMAMMVLLFCIVFGLSMDYEVFVMSRIKERRDAGATIEDSTIGGLTHTGRIVTTAAALIAVSFFAFVTSEVSFLQLFGLGAGVAILLDATLIRGVLVPASMRLLGQRSWYAPPVLRRLHARIGLAET